MKGTADEFVGWANKKLHARDGQLSANAAVCISREPSEKKKHKKCQERFLEVDPPASPDANYEVHVVILEHCNR